MKNVFILDPFELLKTSLPVLIFIVIFIIGYLRHKIENKTPKGLIDIEVINQKWLTENNWSARFSLLFLPFVFLYNILVWFGFGIVSILELLAFLFKKIWSILVYVWSKICTFITFIWFEVIHPTVFWLSKLFWHYPLLFVWYFFEYSFQHIKYAFKTSSISISVKKLLLLTGTGGVLTGIYFLFPNLYSLAVVSFLFLVLFQYTIFSSIALHVSEFDNVKVKPTLITTLIWLGISAVTTIVLVVIEKLNVYPLSAAGVSISQILIPFSFLLGIAFITSVTCLAPYYYNKDKLNILDYLKQVLLRLPKLIYAQPFQLIGVSIVGIMPLLIFFVFNIGVEKTTGRDFEAWISEISLLEQDLVSFGKVESEISTTQNEINFVLKQKDSTTTYENEQIKAIENSKLNLTILLNKIEDKQIHTFDGIAYEGEKQFFSIPSISQCTNYKFLIEKDGEIFLEKGIQPSKDNQSIILNYRWWQSGEYKISLVPENSCGSLNVPDVYVSVEARRLPINAPSGKQIVCENEIVEYTAQDGYDSYEWQHPFGSKTTTTPNITLTWGNISGTIRVRGVNQNGDTTLWTGKDVKVELLPGTAKPTEDFVANEEPNTYKVSRDFTFISREAARDSITKVEDLIINKTTTLNSLNKQFENKLKTLKSELTNLEQKKVDLPLKMIGKFLAILGISLAIALLFSTSFTYLILFHYRLFNFKQNGKHYWEETLQEIQSKNPKQPLLGFFMLLIISALVYSISLII